MCGYESIQQQSKRDTYVPPSSSPSHFVQCISCEKYTCSNCIYGCLATASSISGINDEMMESDSSLQSLQPMKCGLEETPPSLSVEQGTCCAFNTKHVITHTGAACKSYRCEWGWATTLWCLWKNISSSMDCAWKHRLSLLVISISSKKKHLDIPKLRLIC